MAAVRMIASRHNAQIMSSAQTDFPRTHDLGEDVLVISHHSDVHARAVSFGLASVGVKSRIISATDLPGLAVASCLIDAHQCEPDWSDAYGSVSPLEGVLFWNRRRVRSLPPVWVDEPDRSFSATSNDIFHRWLLHPGLFNRSHWINHPDTARLADNKLFQLKTARDHGLAIPRTLAGNDASRAREFMETPSRLGYVCKPLYFGSWKVDGGLKTAYTTDLEVSDLLDPRPLRIAPMIIQEKVEKESELRVIVMGEKMLAGRLFSQELRNSATDWRADLDGEVRIEPFELPAEQERRIFAFMASLGLRFGALDLALTPSGDMVFFEVNEMGQFLWLEEQCADIPLLSEMVRFICKEAPRLKDGPRHAANGLSLDNYYSSRFHRDWERDNQGKHEVPHYGPL